MRIGIDLLWVRVGICGGTESYIRNLLDGFRMYGEKQEYVLFVAKDNADSFLHYAENASMMLYTCNVLCANPVKRILWENLHLDKIAKEQQIDVMFIPVYSMPHRYGSGIPYVSVIHDLQALHYPEYFTWIRRTFLKYTWRNTCKKADRVIATSNYCRDDLVSHYPFVKDKMITIYDPIVSKPSTLDASCVGKYGVEAGKYFYCVSSMLPHKNLETILKVMAEWEEKDTKLVISGVGGNVTEVTECLKRYHIEERVVLTGFVADEVRDCLYENCRLFLYPSIFEGFGMPPIEALQKGKRVVMTKESCLWEITQGKAVYVENPYDVAEWKEKMEYALRLPTEEHFFEDYKLPNVAGNYIIALESLGKRK